MIIHPSENISSLSKSLSFAWRVIIVVPAGIFSASCYTINRNEQTNTWLINCNHLNITLYGNGAGWNEGLLSFIPSMVIWTVAVDVKADGTLEPSVTFTFKRWE